MKRCKKPTEPGYYWYYTGDMWHNAHVKVWQPVKVYEGHYGPLHVKLFWEEKGIQIEKLRGWWGPKISGIDPK